MKLSKIKSEQDFIDYMSVYGTHVLHLIGDSEISKNIHLDSFNSFSFSPNCKTSIGKKYKMEFKINGKPASHTDCFNLIQSYNRGNILNDLLING